MVSELAGKGAVPPQLPEPASRRLEIAHHSDRFRQQIRRGSLLYRGVTKSNQYSLDRLQQPICSGKLKHEPLLARFNLFFLFFNLSVVLSKSSSWSRSMRNSSRVLVIAFSSWRKSMEIMSAELVTIDRSPRSRSAENSSAELALVVLSPQRRTRKKLRMSTALIVDSVCVGRSSAIPIQNSPMISRSQFVNFDVIVSTQPSKVCFNSNCKEASEWPRKGWRRQTGEFADLCDRCASAYEEGGIVADQEAVLETLTVITHDRMVKSLIDVNTGDQYIFNMQSKYSSETIDDTFVEESTEVVESSDCKTFANLFEEFVDKLNDMAVLLPVSKTGKAKTKEGDTVEIWVGVGIGEISCCFSLRNEERFEIMMNNVIDPSESDSCKGIRLCMKSQISGDWILMEPEYVSIEAKVSVGIIFQVSTTMGLIPSVMALGEVLEVYVESHPLHKIICVAEILKDREGKSAENSLYVVERMRFDRGDVAVIQVGAQIEIRLKEQKLRVEDALNATKAEDALNATKTAPAKAVVVKSLVEQNSNNSIHGQVTIGTLIFQDCAVGLLFALLAVLGGISGIQQELFAMGRVLIPLSYFLLLHLDMLGLSLELEILHLTPFTLHQLHTIPYFWEVISKLGIQRLVCSSLPGGVGGYMR